MKNTIGPRVLTDHDLPEFSASFFSAYPAPPLAIPLDLAQHLIHGAVAYARTLGFAPASSYKAAAEHLGPPTTPSPIGFGRHNRPVFVQGPNDNPNNILRTLDRTIGPGNYDYLVTA